jgi:hypothetical protein
MGVGFEEQLYRGSTGNFVMNFAFLATLSRLQQASQAGDMQELCQGAILEKGQEGKRIEP